MFKIPTFTVLAFLISSCQNQKELHVDIEQLNQLENNHKTLQALEDAGDDFTVSRDIFHWIYFKTQADVNDFIQEVASKEFQTVRIKTVDNMLPYQLQIKIKSPVSKEIIEDQTQYLLGAARKCNGDYDGWETSVEK